MMNKQLLSPEQMRAEIYRMRRDNSIVARSLDSADYLGLSSEDRYTILAYHALERCESLTKTIEQYVRITPSTFLISTGGAAK